MSLKKILKICFWESTIFSRFLFFWEKNFIKNCYFNNVLTTSEIILILMLKILKFLWLWGILLISYLLQNSGKKFYLGNIFLPKGIDFFIFCDLMPKKKQPQYYQKTDTQNIYGTKLSVCGCSVHNWDGISLYILHAHCVITQKVLQYQRRFLFPRKNNQRLWN